MRKYLILWLALMPLPLRADTVTVAAAANVQFTLEEIKAAFEKTSTHKVQAIIGSSGKLTSQIENGAPFDVFMSADMDYPQRLWENGSAVAGPKAYAHGSLVLWTVKDIDLSRGIAVLNDPAFARIAIASPQAAPYGREAVRAMRYHRLYPAIEAKLVYGESIAQVNQFITAGVVDAGLTAKSIVMAPNMRAQGKWVDVDPASYSTIAQGAVILKHSQKEHAAAAQEFYDFLFSAPARAILEKYGYSLP